jgi:hypothetical protein
MARVLSEVQPVARLAGRILAPRQAELEVHPDLVVDP